MSLMRLSGAPGSIRKKSSTSTSKHHLCGRLRLILILFLICILFIFPLYRTLFHGIYLTDHNGHEQHDGYNRALSNELLNRTIEDHYDDQSKLGDEIDDTDQSYINSSNRSNGFQYQKEYGEKLASAFLQEEKRHPSTCATVEEMGVAFSGQGEEEASLRVRRMIHNYFSEHGAPRVTELPASKFCRQNFVFGRSSEAGFGNEMYKILTAGALGLLLNRPLILGENRDKHSFGGYITYSNQTFSLKEIKLLWARNDCAGKYKRPLVMRIDDFEMPTRTHVFCEDWRDWKQPIVWFKGTTDTVAIQFFLKNLHPGMRDAASMLLGDPSMPSSRPNLFGELMKVLISPAHAVEEAVNWVLNSGPDPDITLHLRMRGSRSKRALYAAVNCFQRSLHELSLKDAKPRVVLVTDTPSVVGHIKNRLKEYAEVLHFDYKSYASKNVSNILSTNYLQLPQMRAKDWGPMPRWVAFVDFFLASRATRAVISGAHRRVATTYAQLIAAMAAANKLDRTLAHPLNFSFYSSFQSTLLVEGLGNQIGWGHAWNRFGGQLSCHNQTDQCALTPLLPPGLWDGPWQSPIRRDIHRLNNFGVHLTEKGEFSETKLLSFCKSRKVPVNTVTLELPACKKCQKN
ncbi:uncharacterized protein LOC131042848 isoform X2 [Cryptomeria japonica]|uniref:uncharacterized protein LOC131042848 isoform X2 n=1 Tax=Cryptomeria japonica TaxID=3369 RepID=UPI0027DA41CF|nr:uncharacterized protein LOC131042848 isoform X2 [Cryptomeria japonica]